MLLGSHILVLSAHPGRIQAVLVLEARTLRRWGMQR